MNKSIANLSNIKRTCIPSTESGLPILTQGILPDHFDPNTGMYRGNPVTPEQLAFLESTFEQRTVVPLIPWPSASQTV